eukprot:1286632-Amphidinium_carterae.1
MNTQHYMGCQPVKTSTWAQALPQQPNPQLETIAFYLHTLFPHGPYTYALHGWVGRPAIKQHYLYVVLAELFAFQFWEVAVAYLFVVL